MKGHRNNIHQRCTPQRTGWNTRKHEGTGEWMCPDSETTFHVVGIWMIEEDIARRKRTIYWRCLN
jgi:hypothetical protein